MRIDLHTHTQRLKQGDSPARVITPSDYITKMSDNQVGIYSITNHNKFDRAEYDEIVAQAPEQHVIFPGIELDIDFKEEKRQIIVVGNPRAVDLFEATFDGEHDRDYDKFSMPYDDFTRKIQALNKEDIIIIPHFLDKDNGFTIDEKHLIFEALGGYTVILETANLRSMGIVNEHEDRLCLNGSDTTDWSTYSGESIPELKFNINSFERFYELASDPKSFVKNFLSGSTKCDITVGKSGSIEIFDDINIIFGEKGSGKTVLLKDYIYPQLSDAGRKVFIHEGKDYAALYEKMIREHDESVVVDADLISRISRTFDSVVQYSEPHTRDFIEQYTNYRRDTNKNKNAKLILKTTAAFSNDTTVSVDELIASGESFVAKVDDVSTINVKCRKDESNTRRVSLESELYELKREIQQRLITTYKTIFIDQLTEVSLTALQDSVRKNTGKLSKPTNIGFSKIVAKRLAQYNTYGELLGALKSVQRTESKDIGQLPGKGTVKIETSVAVLTGEDKHRKDSVFDKAKIVNNRKIINKINNFTFHDFMNVNEYFDSYDKAIRGEVFCNDVVKKTNVIKIKGNDDYKPSEGERAILSISGILESYSYECYIFDEIERGLGNKYVTDYVITRLKELRSKGKMVIISTHNANIAINTLPSHVIFCAYPDSEVYYTGNMYSNDLVGVKAGGLKAWDEMAILHLEGGESMFNKRRNIYGY